MWLITTRSQVQILSPLYLVREVAMRVQCKGSGRQVAGFARRATCTACGNQQDVASNGRIRKHMRVVTKAQLRKM